MSAVPQTRLLLSADAYRRIDRETAKFPAEQRRSSVMAALATAQDELGWLSKEAIEEVAGYLGMPPIAVYEVATFYSMYNLKPVGRHKITICADGAFTLKEGECFGACGDAPVLLVNNKRMESFMSNEKLDALLSELELTR